MVKITLDHSALIFYHRHPGIKQLIDMHRQGSIRLYHATNADYELEELNEEERKAYEQLRAIIFGNNHITLTQHGDLCLLIKHMNFHRDYFVTLYPENYGDAEKYFKNLDIRFPDEEFIKELQRKIGKKQRK
ncbi:MAG: hypothetical protein J7K72_03075 [Candidatus Aenigmarchaeota archaeon]|nr:hypothetical protein [Candidatus Aenigmarchaeota archaeon]